MRVRAYIDGFNLYYGGRALAGRIPGWKWLDLRALVGAIVDRRWTGRGARLEHVTYCTARVLAATEPDARVRQEAYLQALLRSGSVDRIEYGEFFEKVKRRPLASEGPKGRPILHQPVTWVDVADREEKGSDVSLASHLLIDDLTGEMDSAVVVSNDSDLAFPVQQARARIPVGTVNPHGGPPAGALRPPTEPGCGHWFHVLSLNELQANQLPDPCSGIARPRGW